MTIFLFLKALIKILFSSTFHGTWDTCLALSMAHGIFVMNILQGAHGGEHIVPLHDTAFGQATYSNILWSITSF